MCVSDNRAGRLVLQNKTTKAGLQILNVLSKIFQGVADFIHIYTRILEDVFN